MICVKCEKESGVEFYKNDKKCKPCRRAMVRVNRMEKSDYYREYDRVRFINDPRVAARHIRYANSDAGKASGNRAKDKYTNKNPIKKLASTVVGNAIRCGKLIKPSECSKCFDKNERIHGHHDDYAFPLIVRWLCPKCHKEWHKENGEGINAS